MGTVSGAIRPRAPRVARDCPRRRCPRPWTRSARIPLKSATASADAVRLEFLCEPRSLCVHSPGAVRIQETDIGLVQALEIDGLDGQFIRLAFRATALPEQLDGLAPGELNADSLAHCRAQSDPHV